MRAQKSSQKSEVFSTQNILRAAAFILPMTRRTTSAELTTLIIQVISEAKSGSGTWSLQTYADLRKVIDGFDAPLAHELVEAIMEGLFSEDKPTTRYKLAQMCTILRSLKPQIFEPIFAEFRPKIESKYKEIEEADDIGHSTVKLLKSLFQELARRRGSAGFHSQFLLKTQKLCPQASARTPDPNSCEHVSRTSPSLF